MASTELGFLALPQFLKGTTETSILPSLPPLDPFAGITGRRPGMGHLFPRRPLDWWCRGSGPRWRLVGASWWWRRHWRGLVGRGFFRQKINQDRVLWQEDWAGGAVGTMAVALGTLGVVVMKGATQGGGSSTRLSQVIT